MSPLNPRTRSALGAVLVVAVVGGLVTYAYLGILEPERAAAVKKAHDERLLGARVPNPSSPFIRLRVDAKAETTTLARDPDGRWHLTAPMQAAADATVVQEVLRQLQTARMQSMVVAKPSAEELQKFGLSPPHFRVEAQSASGTGSFTLEGGEENPYDGSIYVRRAGEDAVYSAPGGLRFALEHTPFDFQDKALLPVDFAEVRRVDVNARKHRFTLARTREDRWELLENHSHSPADTGTVRSALDGLKAQRAVALVKDSPEAREQLGVSAPSVELTLTDTTGNTVHLRFARTKTDGLPATAVLREEAHLVVLGVLQEAALGLFDRAANDWKDKSVLTFSLDAVRALVFVPGSGGTPFALERVKADEAAAVSWRLRDASGRPAQGWKVSALLWSLRNLKVQATPDVQMKPLSQFGLGAQAGRIELEGAGGKKLAVLRLGGAVPDKDTRYVQSAPGPVVEVDAERLKDIPQSIDEVLVTSPEETRQTSTSTKR